MPIFGNISSIVASSGSIPTSSFSVLPFFVADPSYGLGGTASIAASVNLNILTQSSAGVAAEMTFNLPSPENSTTAGVPVLKLFTTGSNNEPRVGIGFEENETILKPFEVKSKTDSAEGTEILVRSSRTSIGAQQGDSVGSINFVIDSSSFEDITTTGSIARIKTKVNDPPSATEGVNGQLTFAISRDIDTEIDMMEMAYAQGTYSTLYSTVTTHSIEIKDINQSSTPEQNASFVHSNGTNAYTIIRTDNPNTGNAGGLIQVNNKFGTGTIFLHGPSGQITASNLVFEDGDTGTTYPTTITSDGGVGDVVSLGSTSGLTAGNLYYWNGTSWSAASATNSATSSLVAIAKSINSSNGMILRGIVQTGDALTAGAPAYISASAGQVSSTQPTSGAVRVMGYALDTTHMYFNPSPDWITLS